MKPKIKILIIAVCIIIVGITAFVIPKIANKQQNNTDINIDIDENFDEILQPKINAPNSIVVEVLDFSQKFVYSFENLSEYQYTIIVLDENIANLVNDYIIPVSIGQTTIKIEINSEPKVCSTTTLEIIDW